MKKKTKIILLSILAVLVLVFAGVYILLLKPLQTFKQDVSSIQNDDGSYELSLSMQTAAGTEAIGSAELERDSTLFAGTAALASDPDNVFGFYYDSSSRDALVKIGPVLKAVLPDSVKAVDSALGITASLNDRYISVAQLSQISGVSGSDGLAAIAGVLGISSSGDATTDLAKAYADLTILKNGNYYARPLLSLKVLEQKGLETDGWYFYQIKQDGLSETLYVGFEKKSTDGVIRMQALLDYDDEAATDFLVTLAFTPQEESITLPDSILSSEQTELLTKLADLYRAATAG